MSVPPRRRRLTAKRILITLAVLVLFVALLGLAGGIYIRSENFNRYLIGEINAKLKEYGLRGEIGGTEFSLRGQTARLRDFKIYNDLTGRPIASIKRVELIAEIREPYAIRLSREIALKKLNLEGVELHIEIDERGQTNFEGLRNVPATKTAIEIDYSQLLATLTEGAIYFKDRLHKVETDLTGLKISAQPQSSNPIILGLQLDSTDGRFSYQNREVKIDTLSLRSRVSDSGAEIEQLDLKSGLAAVTAKGRIDDWKAFRYSFDFDSQVKLEEASRLFVPDLAMKGLATSRGRVDGAGTIYNIKCDLNAEDMTVAGARMRNTRIAQFNFDSKGDHFNFGSSQLRAQSVTIDDIRTGSVAINNLKGDIKNGRAQANATSANVDSVEWPESRLSNLALNGLNMTFSSSGHDLRYEVKTDAILNQGTISGVSFNNATTQAIFDNSALTLTGIRGDLFGGSASGNFTLPLARGAASKATASFTDLQTKDVFSLIAAKSDPATADKTVSQVPLAGKISGDAEISIVGAKASSINGAINARFDGKASQSADSPDAIPVRGEAAINARNGVFNFEQLQLSTDASKLTANGQLSVDGDSDLRINITTTQAEQLLQIARSIDVARPYITEYEPQLIGDFKFEGRIAGQIDKATIEGDVNAATAGLRDALLGALSGHILVSPAEVRVEKGVITASNGGSLKFDLITPLDSKADSGKLDAVIERINLETILAAAGSPDASQIVAGDVTGEAHLTGLPASLNGSAQLSLVDGKIADQPAQIATANLKFNGRNALLERLEVKLPQSHMTANGEMNLDDYSFKVQGKGDQISLQGIADAFELKDTRIGGTANADLIISGKVITGKKPDLDWESLQVYLLAQGKDVKINGRDTGELRFGARTSAGGRLDFGLVTGILATVKSAAPQDKSEVIRGNIELRRTGRPVTIEGDLVDQNLAPLFELLAPTLKVTIAGTVSGKLHIEGPTLDENGKATFDRLRGGFTLTKADLEVENTPVKIETPVTIALEETQIKVSNSRFTGPGLDLGFNGALGLKGDAGMNFSLNGTVNLGQLPAIPADLLLTGRLTIDARLTGTAESPNLSGKIDTNGFGLTAGDLPVFISDGVGHITLTGDQLKLDNFTASLNEGKLEANGAMKLVQLRPSEWRFSIKAVEAVINYQDISATANGDLVLNGTPQGQTLGGTITIPQAEYIPRVDLDNLLTGGSSGLTLAGFSASGDGGQRLGIPPVNLNIRLDAHDSLFVQNEQINAVGSAVITLTGTLTDPDPAGRIETDGGLVRFRGQRYEITVGSLDFPPGSGDTLLNLTAESEISGHRVTIGFVGPIDNIELTLQSEPRLSRDEIIALITTGRVETGTLIGPDLLRSGVGAAASLITSGLISKPTEELLGISRFQIDPVIRPNTNPAARLTIGQQLSRNLYVSYSTNLSSQQDQTALAEYTFTNRFSALMTYTQGGSSANEGDKEGDLIIELRGRKRFSLGYSPDDQLARTGGSASTTDPLNRIATAKLPAAAVNVSPVPDLKLSDKKLRELLPIMKQGFSRSLARLGQRRLLEYLQEHGYFFAEVNYRCDPQSCSGDDLRVFYNIQPGAIYDLEEMRIEGTDLIKLSNIEGELQSQRASRVGGIPFLKDLPLIGGYVRGLTSNDRLRSDEETIRRYMLEMGFRSARVRSRLAVKADNDDLIVIFDVDQGPQAQIAGINLRGNTILTAQEVRAAVPIQTGEVFSLTRARTGEQHIKQLYAQHGFLDTTTEVELVDTNEDNVVLVYNINEGPRAIVSEIEITGLIKTGDNWVRRYLDFKKGDVLTPAKIRQTQRDLYATNAFREVTIRSEPIAGGEGSAHKVTVNLTEAKPLLLVYGLGYSTDDGVRGLIEIANTNLGGSLDTLSLRMRASRLEQFAQTSFTDMRPFGWRFPTTFSVFYSRNTNLRPFVTRRVLEADGDVVDDDEETDLGFQRFAAFVQTERKLDERTYLRFRYNLERQQLFGSAVDSLPDTEVTRNERAIRLGMFSVGFTRDNRDSAINSTRGDLISADNSIAANFLGGNESFNKFFGTYQRYRTLDPHFPLLRNSTLAFSARIGLAGMFRPTDRNDDGIIGESERRLPITERFFSGGATTLRGFRFEAAGPQAVLEPRPGRSCDTDFRPCDLPILVPVGGDALAVFNFELRYPLSQRFRLVPFYDLGNGFRRIGDINFSNMTNTIGLGLRINTPIGPIGVDYGFLIDPPFYVTQTGAVLRQPRGAFHIRFGQSF
ncbi:MAG: translocation/assembly module TamB domain-containing protein [Acidobacteria bacterium]|nr:translocation/assembly module TamB domain-containing protein [Acidobacteriota bacterium]